MWHSRITLGIIYSNSHFKFSPTDPDFIGRAGTGAGSSSKAQKSFQALTVEEIPGVEPQSISLSHNLIGHGGSSSRSASDTD